MRGLIHPGIGQNGGFCALVALVFCMAVLMPVASLGAADLPTAPAVAPPVVSAPAAAATPAIPAAQAAPAPGPVKPTHTAKITAENLPDEIKKAQDKLAALAKIPSGLTAEQLTVLRKRAFGFNLREESMGLWAAIGRAGDVGRTGPPGYVCSALSKAGNVIVLFGVPAKGAETDNAEDLKKRAQGYTIADRATDDDMKALAKRAHADEKLFYANPSTAELTAFTDEKLSDLAKATDIFNVQACAWWNADTTAEHTDFLAKVAQYSAAIRKANPACKVFIDVGRGGTPENHGTLATEWVKMLATIDQKDPALYDGVYLSAPVQTVDQPELGLQQIQQMLAWMRP